MGYVIGSKSTTYRDVTSVRWIQSGSVLRKTKSYAIILNSQNSHPTLQIRGKRQKNEGTVSLFSGKRQECRRLRMLCSWISHQICRGSTNCPSTPQTREETWTSKNLLRITLRR